MTDADTLKVLRFLIEHDCLNDKLYYGDESGPFFSTDSVPEKERPIGIAENCNDLWYWACADYEEITPKDLSAYEQAIKDCEALKPSYSAYAGTVWACRKRGMRPQNPCYASYPKELWPLLDAAGPERDEKTAGSRKRAEQKYEDRQRKVLCQACQGSGRVLPTT